MSFNRKLGKQTVVSPKLESHSGTERNDVLIYASTWTSLENIMLGKKNSVTKRHMLWFCLYLRSRIGKFIQKEGRLVVARDLGEGRTGDRQLMGAAFL